MCQLISVLRFVEKKDGNVNILYIIDKKEITDPS